MSTLFGFGIGIASLNKQDQMLDTLFPAPLAHVSADQSAQLLAALKAAKIDYNGGNAAIRINVQECRALAQALAGQPDQAAIAKHLSDTERQPVVVVLATDSEPASVAEAYLKLQLLSHRLIKPHQQNLGGIFACLPNVAWTSEGPIDTDELAERQLQARCEGRWIDVKSVEKFPQMTDYVVPSGVRIAATSRVRLGAYIGAGTTIMHEGFVNFNAGTAGTSMIEGRISAGVFVDEGSDLGGGSSTMGTLSGGGAVVISVGKNCLIGANAGIGIGLGDRCIVEAGLYVTAGTKVALLDDKGELVSHTKARDLSGKSDLLFRRNSQTGAVECKTHQSKVELNEALHANN